VADRRRTPARSIPTITLGRAAAPGAARADAAASRLAARDQAGDGLLTGYLKEVRERLGADEAILWRRDAHGTLSAVAWSTAPAGDRPELAQSRLDGQLERGEPPRFQSHLWMPRVEWATAQRLLQLDRRTADGMPWDDGREAPRGAGALISFAVAPGEADMRGCWALSLSAAGPHGLAGTESAIRAAVARAAAHAAALAGLMQSQRQAERQARQANVLVNSAKMFQAKRSIDGLGETVCRDALQVTGAAGPGGRSALVKWDEERRTGFVQCVSPGHAIATGQPVSTQSRVGEMCVEDQAQVWEDARVLGRSVPVYGPGEPSALPGSLAVVPMKQEGRVVGAIVVEGGEAYDIQWGDVGAIRTLAAIAAASLAQLWRIERANLASITDELTGLSNRRHFDQQLLLLLSRADQQRQPLSLILADIDHFKRVNDTFGHEAGDAVLQAIGGVVRATVRKGGEDLCARYGGEEVAILLPGVAAAEAAVVAERLRRSVAAAAVTYAGQRIPITASFGVACYPQTAAVHAALFPAADRALYLAKSGGRNRVKAAGVTAGPVVGYSCGPRAQREVGPA